MDSKEIYKAFGLTDKMIENISNSQETTQKQLDIFLEKFNFEKDRIETLESVKKDMY
ncbi:hypothetical protein NE398_11835 [Clostridium tertium]|uniref:Uncharacterized protein n=1 Tax=Clostridium tertium TaxID=1559 RepID=A0A9X4B0G0_9CLOT|nr:hypothetical protein [Clostridium tertium]MDC4240849.1 hypothetical protein [Clostridium tertium]